MTRFRSPATLLKSTFSERGLDLLRAPIDDFEGPGHVFRVVPSDETAVSDVWVRCVGANPLPGLAREESDSYSDSG